MQTYKFSFLRGIGLRILIFVVMNGGFYVAIPVGVRLRFTSRTWATLLTGNIGTVGYANY